MHGCTGRRFGDPTSGSVLCRQITLLLFFSFSQGSEKEKIQRCFRYRLNYHDDFLPHKPKAGWTNLRIWEINFPCCQHAKAMKMRFHSLSGYHKCALCAPQNQPEMLRFAILPLFSVRAAKGLLDYEEEVSAGDCPSDSCSSSWALLKCPFQCRVWHRMSRKPLFSHTTRASPLRQRLAVSWLVALPASLIFCFLSSYYYSLVKYTARCSQYLSLSFSKYHLHLFFQY